VALTRITVATAAGRAQHNEVALREEWSYEWIPVAAGTHAILCRAVDDSGNLEAAHARVTVEVAAPYS